jgi:hypothetical protein
MFGTACDSASITSIASKWQETYVARGHFKRVGWVGNDSRVVLGEKRSVGLVTKVGGEVFAHFNAVRIDWLFSQDEIFVNIPLMSENVEHALDFALHMSHLFRSALNRACHSGTRVQLMLSFPNACLIFARVSVAIFPRFAQNLMLFFCRIHHEIASSHICTTPNKRK